MCIRDSSWTTRRTRGGDFYLATTGDLYLAISGDFSMATDKGRPTRRGGGGGSPGFRRHRDGNGHEQHGLPSTAGGGRPAGIQTALLPAIRHDIHRVWLDRTRSAMVSICRDRGPCGCRYNKPGPA